MADTVYVVNGGLDLVTALLASSAIRYVGWGTGTTAATVSDTGLETAAAESRVSGTQTQQTTSTTDDTYQVIATITCTGSGKTISECGIFDAATSGNLYLRATFTGITLSVGDSIQFTLKTQYNQG